jgi:predicted RNase H-like HicB family nuclease
MTSLLSNGSSPTLAATHGEAATCVVARTFASVLYKARTVESQQEGPMKYKIALLETEEGYSVSVPGLPGCWSQGATEEEALRNIQDAIQEYLAARDDLLQGATVREVEVAS